MRKLLSSNRLSAIDTIIHIADVHIRNYKRHEEYNVVFDRVYDYCREQVSLNPNTLIYLAGDIVHAKTDMSPELVSITRQFIQTLVNIAPTILIPGNHDCYTGDHEVLTKNGWINIEQYVNDNMSDEVMTFNNVTGLQYYDYPTSKIKKQYTGEIIHVIGDEVDLKITPTHRVLYYDNSTYNLCETTAEQLTVGDSIPCNDHWPTGAVSRITSINRIPYDDTVYCLTVPSSYLLIRRNGKISISGNCNLNNSNRLDALSPIVDSIVNEDMFYLKTTGVYSLCGIDFVHNSVFDDPSDFITPDMIDGDFTKIVLFHGAIDKSKNDQGMEMKNNRITVESFAGFDYGLFGDIHSFQYLNNTGTMAYAGSLIQQNFGESLTHGIIHWDLKNKESHLVKIENDWGYHTIDIDNGKFVHLPKVFSKYNRIRVKSYNTTNADLITLISKLKSTVKVDDIRIQKFSNKMSSITGTSVLRQTDVRDVEYQNKLITDYIEKNYTESDQIIDTVRSINRKINTQISKTNVLRNVVWTPIKFEFENMFSYGEHNSIDMSAMNGTYGLFASNASGKSSLLDALLFCIFDTCSRTFKASQVLNNKKDSFYCKFEFELAGRHFFIERRGIKDKKGHVKVNVEFWYEENGDIVSLNGDDRDGTNFAIRNYLGKYDDFIITALSLQSNNTNFIDKAQRERKDLLAQFLDLNLFEELNLIAADEIKSVQTLIREFTRQDFSTKVADATAALSELNGKLITLNDTKTELLSESESFNSNILELAKQLKPIDDDTTLIDLSKCIAEKGDILIKIERIDTRIATMQAEYDSNTKILASLETKLSTIDIDALSALRAEYDALKLKSSLIQSSISEKTLEIAHNQSKIDKLSTHEYDPNCKYCVNNTFVQDAIESKSMIQSFVDDKSTLDAELSVIQCTMSELYHVFDKISNFDELNATVVTTKHQLYLLSTNINDIVASKMKLESSLELLSTKINKYILNEASIKANQQIQLEISELEHYRESVAKKLYGIEESILDISGNARVYENTVNDCAANIKKLNELETEFKAYDLYLKCVNRNGIPYELISDAIPKIQHEVNGILSQIVEFEILFETDGKSINTYIVYDDENYWPLEMTSGMEKFISSLAIRVALINVASLPRPNFIAIDEGFGALDSDNLNSLHMFFDYLKTHFDFILTVSHIDALRDIMDNIIEIKKENGFSHIDF